MSIYSVSIRVREKEKEPAPAMPRDWFLDSVLSPRTSVNAVIKEKSMNCTLGNPTLNIQDCYRAFKQVE